MAGSLFNEMTPAREANVETIFSEAFDYRALFELYPLWLLTIA